MAAADTLHGFTPEENERDVALRRPWPLTAVLDELRRFYGDAAAAVAAAGGRLDVLACGEWVHGGDVREALGWSDAYASDGVEDAVLELGSGTGPAADLVCDRATLVRLSAGREVDSARFTLDSLEPAALAVLA